MLSNWERKEISRKIEVALFFTFLNQDKTELLLQASENEGSHLFLK